jgi:hypothetical protein
LLFIPLVACAGAVLGVSAAIAADSITHTRSRWASTAAIRLAQSEESTEEKSIPPADVQKYIAVYTAMQRDHKLTVEQAASREGLTVAQFRSLEFRIERDPEVHQRVIKALRKAAKTPAQNPSGQTR